MQPPVVEGLTETAQTAKMLAMLTMLGLQPRRRPSGGADKREAGPAHGAPIDRGPKTGPIAGPNLKTPV